MSKQQQDELRDLVEGMVYGRCIEAGVERNEAVRISNRAARRITDMTTPLVNRAA